jgi:DNA-binding XRE family transcriptional regulator
MVVEDSQQLGRAIAVRRRELGLSQEEVAYVVGRHRRVIGELERGKPTVRLQIAIDVCRALGLDLSVTSR